MVGKRELPLTLEDYTVAASARFSSAPHADQLVFQGNLRKIAQASFYTTRFWKLWKDQIFEIR